MIGLSYRILLKEVPTNYKKDVWEVRERGKAMGIFYLGPLLGPLLAPIIGGALSEKVCSILVSNLNHLELR